MKSSIALSRIAAAAVLATFSGTLAAQQSYPNRPIRWVTPYPPGGSTTTLSRLIGDKLGEAFGQNVIIDNRPGGNTTIGASAVVRAAPDGYTVLLGGNAQVVMSVLMKPPYDVFKDLAPVTIIAQTNYILVVHPASPANTLQEFITYAKARPGQLNVASVATGSSQHLMGELFGILTGVKMQHIPYKGGQQGIVDLMGGGVQASFSNAINVIPHIRNGKLKGLAITGAKRTATVPQVPTYAESGLPDYDPKNFQGMLAPAGTPSAIVNKLSDEIRKILQLPQIIERLHNGGMEPYHTGPEKMAVEMKRAYEETAKVVKIANIKVDSL